MITAGVDVGFETIQAVIIQDGKILGRACGLSAGGYQTYRVEAVWQEALTFAKITANDVEKVAATGEGKEVVAFAQKRITEPLAEAKAGKYYFPQATSVVDVGADQVRVVTIGQKDGAIDEFVLNQKCAAGVGAFLKDFAIRRLGWTLEQLSALPHNVAGDSMVSDGCRVFAELDALSLLNHGKSPQVVAGAVVEAMAVRISSVLKDKVRPARDTTVLLGGVAKNKALVAALQVRTGISFLIPDDACYGCAVGAALIAAN